VGTSQEYRLKITDFSVLRCLISALYDGTSNLREAGPEIVEVVSASPQAWVQPDLTPIALRIVAGDETAETELFNTLNRGMRLIVARRLGRPDFVDDVVNEVFRITIGNLRSGKLNDPCRLLGYIRSIIHHVVAGHIQDQIRERADQCIDSVIELRLADQRESPEEILRRRESESLVNGTLSSLNPRDREILTRFYLDGETQEQICAAMGLTETQFRLLKSRAKSRFGTAGKRRLSSFRLRLAS
jgi:RNA polymerase sigma-70 factor, ECF subfamily